jgi:hypothetical protein
MKRRGAVAVLLLLALGGLSGAAAPRPPPPPAAGPAAFYAALPVAERVAIKTDLMWSGDYDGAPDGDMSASALAAIRLFQQRNGGQPTGVLNPLERRALAAAARTAQEAVGWRLVEDPRTGVRLGVPSKLAAHANPGPNGTTFSSARGEIQIETFRLQDAGTSLQALFDQHRKDPARTVETAVLRADSFVISGRQGGVKKFHLRADIKGGEVRGEIIRYDLATEGTMGRLVNAMVSAFAAFPTGVMPSGAAHKGVEYATGIIIDRAGGILTDRQATDACQVITVAGLGNAERLAEEGDLALLRLYGKGALRTVAVAASEAGLAEVMLAGVADPQLQAGGGAVTKSPARLGAAGPDGIRALDPAPAAGFSGAAALDAAGELVGLVTLRPAAAAGAPVQAALVPGDVLRRFLDRAHVGLDPASPAASGHPESLESAIVRVICTRA